MQCEVGLALLLFLVPDGRSCACTCGFVVSHVPADDARMHDADAWMCPGLNVLLLIRCLSGQLLEWAGTAQAFLYTCFQSCQCNS